MHETANHAWEAFLFLVSDNLLTALVAAVLCLLAAISDNLLTALVAAVLSPFLFDF